MILRGANVLGKEKDWGKWGDMYTSRHVNKETRMGIEVRRFRS
jgi:hypothetical protein